MAAGWRGGGERHLGGSSSGAAARLRVGPGRPAAARPGRRRSRCSPRRGRVPPAAPACPQQSLGSSEQGERPRSSRRCQGTGAPTTGPRGSSPPQGARARGERDGGANCELRGRARGSHRSRSKARNTQSWLRFVCGCFFFYLRR